MAESSPTKTEDVAVVPATAAGIDESPLRPVPNWRAWTLLIVFSMAQLLDLFNVTAPTIALTSLGVDLDINESQRQWVINAYSLTFGAFLLAGGRFSAMFGSKALFVVGFSTVGICCIILGFSVDGPMFFFFRAIQGIGAAMTIPSALTMITTVFPDRSGQSRALGIFAGFGAMGNIGGLILGGVISQLLKWNWIFWIMSMVILPLAFCDSAREHLRKMDWLGLFGITASLVLFIFALSEVEDGSSAIVLAPLIISIILVPVVGYIETKVAAPLIPPVVWTLPGFVPLFFISMSDYATMNVLIFQESLVFQHVWNTSALSAALRIIPIGITGFIVTMSMGFIVPYVAPRWILVIGEIFMLGGVLLAGFGSQIGDYWPRVLPAFIIEALGIASVFVAANIAILRTPLGKPSVHIHESTALIGAIFNADLQIGSTIGLAVATAITTKVNGTNQANFAGYKASYWFIIAVCALEAVLALVAFRPVKEAYPSELVDSEDAEKTTHVETSAA
ncbi:major facilitator superfamily domain-containing protein [Rhodocollybia butyracea]|uniref:Major facilitator superfamily domain-containing protein n=1 Tax=Rhodocollybia butyracea TaxID=206335 RepID=A0A9P5U0S1_9AGAR|nr:major facilitator superfamily domain-containing protein [Rhodocollybia butyracea]